jgi:hemoglobin
MTKLRNWRRRADPQSQQTANGVVSDYELVGGGPAISAVVDRFYELVLGDPRLAPFFTNSDMARLKRHQVLLISQVMGGPAAYDGRDLRDAHAGLQIRSEDFALVVSYLTQTLQEFKVDPAIMARVGTVLAATENDVVAVAAD